MTPTTGVQEKGSPPDPAPNRDHELWTSPTNSRRHPKHAAALSLFQFQEAPVLETGSDPGAREVSAKRDDVSISSWNPEVPTPSSFQNSARIY